MPRPSNTSNASTTSNTTKISNTSMRSGATTTSKAFNATNATNTPSSHNSSPNTTMGPPPRPSQPSQSVPNLFPEWQPVREPIPLHSFFEASAGSLPPCDPKDWPGELRFCEHKPGCMRIIDRGHKYVTVPYTNGTCKFVSPDCFTSEDQMEGSSVWLSHNPAVFEAVNSSLSRKRTFVNEAGGIEHNARFVARAECVLCRSKFVSDNNNYIGRLSWHGSPYTQLLSHFNCYLQWSAGSQSSPQSQGTSWTTKPGSGGGSFGVGSPFPAFLG